MAVTQMRLIGTAPCTRLSGPAARGLPALPRRSAARAEASSSQAGKFAAVSAATTLLAANSALAAQEVSLVAADNRALIIATVFFPVVGWVLFNIGGPALNQVANINAKRDGGAGKGGRKRAAVGPLAGLTAAGLMLSAQHAEAAQEVVGSLAADTRGAILASLFLPALGWVAFNIGGPALNQVANINAKRDGGSRGKFAK